MNNTENKEDKNADNASPGDRGFAGIPAYFEFSNKQKKEITSTFTKHIRWGFPTLIIAFVLYLLGLDINHFILYYFIDENISSSQMLVK